MLGNQWRELENMKAQSVAVNGIRKVACVVGSDFYITFYIFILCFTRVVGRCFPNLDSVVFPSWQLSANLRHIRVFEMDVEDEDDESADSQNASADQDGLEAAMSSQGLAEECVDAEGGSGGDGLKKPDEQLESEEALELA